MLIKTYKNEEGSLTPIEFKDLPFEPKRVFYITNVPANNVRGCHAHYTTQQLLVCVRGSIMVKLDYGGYADEIPLKANESVFCDRMVWDEQKYLSEDSILMSICSTEHDPKDYITDYQEFLKVVNKS